VASDAEENTHDSCKIRTIVTDVRVCNDGAFGKETEISELEERWIVYRSFDVGTTIICMLFIYHTARHARVRRRASTYSIMRHDAALSGNEERVASFCRSNEAHVKASPSMLDVLRQYCL